MPFQERVERYIESLMIGGVMFSDPGTLNIEDLVETWVLLKYTKDRVEKRLKDLRAELLDRAERFGRPTAKGGSKLSVNGSLVLREKRVASLPEEKGLKALLAKHGLKNDQAFSKVTQVVMDASKVRALADLGKIPEDEIEALRNVSWALRVKESYDLADVLEALVGEQGQEIVERVRTKRQKAIGGRKDVPEGIGNRKPVEPSIPDDIGNRKGE
jgi:hypothetical protein